MPGSLSVRKRNAAGTEQFNVPNMLRTFLQGVTYANSDEAEAYLRTLFSKDPNAYRREVNRIRGELERYGSANPNTALALELAGMVGGSALTPQLAAVRGVGALSRVAPRIANSGATRFIAGGVDDALQGALYAAGQANTKEEIPQMIREEAPVNAAYYLGIGGAGAGLKAARRKALSTQTGYDLAKKLEQLWDKWRR